MRGPWGEKTNYKLHTHRVYVGEIFNWVLCG